MHQLSNGINTNDSIWKRGQDSSWRLRKQEWSCWEVNAQMPPAVAEKTGIMFR